jgi:hypothetical protein
VRLGTIELSRQRRSYLHRVGHAGAGDRGLFARLDVRANLVLAVAVTLATGSRAAQTDLVAAAIDQFDLGDLISRRVDLLSSGQRQRVRAARSSCSPCSESSRTSSRRASSPPPPLTSSSPQSGWPCCRCCASPWSWRPHNYATN